MDWFLYDKGLHHERLNHSFHGKNFEVTRKLERFCIAAEAYSKSSQTSKKELFAKKVNVFQPLTIFAKKLHLTCLNGFSIRLCKEPINLYSEMRKSTIICCKNNRKYLLVYSLFFFKYKCVVIRSFTFVP